MTKILAIDDKKSNLISLQGIIEDTFPDSMIFTALDGAEGIALAIKEDPDIIILDILMPDMDGYEVCQRLKQDERVKDIPVVFLTVIRDDKNSRIKALDIGAEAFLSKPIDKAELIAQIRAMIKIKYTNRQKQKEQERLERIVAERTRELEQNQLKLLKLMNELKEENEQRKKTEEALRESETHFRTLADSGQALIWTSDIEKKCNYVNKPWLSFTGRRLEQELGNVWVEGVHPDDKQQCVNIYNDAFDHHENFSMEYRIRNSHGEYRWIQENGSPRYNSIGEFIGYISHCLDISERKKDEEILRIAEEKFRAIFENNVIPVAIIEPDTTISIVNDAFCKIITYTREELIGKSWTQLISPEDVERLKEYNRRRLINPDDAPNKYEFLFLKKDGSTGIGMLSISMIRSLKKIIISFEDITERKQMEIELQQSMEKFSKVFSLNPSAMSIIDINNQYLVIDCNYAFEQMTGHQRDQIIGASADTINFYPDLNEKEKIRNEIETKGKIQNLEYHFYKKNGDIGVGLLSVEVIRLAGNDFAIAATQDISQRVSAEKSLRENEIRFSLLSTQSRTFVWEVNSDGIYTYLSSDCEYIIGYSSEDLIGKMHFYDLHPEFGREAFKTAAFEIFARKEPILNLNNPIQTKNGDILWVSTNGMPLLNDDGTLKGYLGSDMDITERREFITALQEAKTKAEMSDNLKTAFMNNISHEVRTPLNGILGFGELLAMNELTDEEKKESLEILKYSSDRLLRTINDYMDISLIISGNQEVHKEAVIVDDLLNELLKTFQSKCTAKGLLLSLISPPLTASESIYTDSTLLLKVLDHLLDNAIKFTKKGEIKLGVIKKGDCIEFFVKDTGVGIEKENINLIFEHFRQADFSNTRGYEGNGLGLSISKGYTQLLGGEIRVETIKDVGTTFYIVLPLQ